MRTTTYVEKLRETFHEGQKPNDGVRKQPVPVDCSLALNRNQLRQNWNFNRFFMLLNRDLRIADSFLTGVFAGPRGGPENALSSRIYRPWNKHRFFRGREILPDLVVVAQHGRFGNMIRQVGFAIATAEKLGVKEVLVKSLPDFPVGTWVLDNGVTLTHDRLLRPRMMKRPSLVLGGDFFVKRRLPVEVQDVDFEVIGRSLGSILGLPMPEELTDDTLVIHFRSGDAFSERPHGALGQPPLSFYEKVIEHESPAKVILVCENLANPVIERVRSLIDSRGIPVSVSSSGFRQDLAILLGAQILVTANGTLAEALLLLSPRIKRWVSFGGNFRPYFRRRALDSTVSVVDLSGEYSRAIMKGNWQNSPAQREMMLNFPGDNLEIQEHSGSGGD